MSEINKILTQFRYQIGEQPATANPTIFHEIPENQLDILENTMVQTKYTGIEIPTGTTAERPTILPNVHEAYLRYNTTIGRMEVGYNNNGVLTWI